MAIDCIPVSLLTRLKATDLPVVLALARAPMTKPELTHALRVGTGGVWKVVDRLRAAGVVQEVGRRGRAPVWALSIDDSRPQRELALWARPGDTPDSRPERDVAPPARPEPRHEREFAPEARSGAPHGVLHGGDDGDGRDEQLAVVALLEAEGLDRIGAELLVRTTPLEEILYTLEHVWPILREGALNPAGRLTVAIRRRTTPAAARKMAAGCSAEGMTDDRARSVGRSTVPAAESKIVQALGSSGPLPVVCTRCGGDGEQIGPVLYCRSTCDRSFKLERTASGWEDPQEGPEGEPLSVPVVALAQAVPS